ncbi:MAG: hypothetical protein IE919_18635 [Thioclava sp.]|nr:hypothetical protein [Thioclava sp.]MBD3805233.1 hypothetical protein [Thioclava sp.]
MQRLLLALSALSLSGCMAGTIYTGGTPQTASIEELCKVVHWGRGGFDYGSAGALEELRARQIFTAGELASIKDGLPRVGQSEAAARCALPFADPHMTVTRRGAVTQWAEPDLGLYVYARAGRVVGVQS